MAIASSVLFCANSLYVTLFNLTLLHLTSFHFTFLYVTLLRFLQSSKQFLGHLEEKHQGRVRELLDEEIKQVAALAIFCINYGFCAFVCICYHIETGSEFHENNGNNCCWHFSLRTRSDPCRCCTVAGLLPVCMFDSVAQLRRKRWRPSALPRPMQEI